MGGIIGELCRKYTALTERDIRVIVDISKLLQPIADIEEADIFIDCPMPGGDSIVVAEAKPSKVPSSYKKKVVGLFAKQENEPAVARTFRLGVGTRQMKATTQENGCTIQTVEPIRAEGRVIAVLIREKRVDEQPPVSESLHVSKQSYSRIVSSLARMQPEDSWLTECIDEGLLLVNPQGIITFRNGLAKRLYERLGYVDDILGQPYHNVRLVEEAKVTAPEDAYSYTEVSVGHSVLQVRRMLLGTAEVEFAVLLKDITKQKEQEKALILKSVAIKEMHHRIKNNLQTIASLLRLQIRRTENEDAKQVLGESMNRILSIASTHQLLAQSGVDEVPLREVIANIRGNALRTLSGLQPRLTVTIEGDDFKVDSDIATSVALIINELLQNALKYAFEDEEEGQVRIVLTRGELYSKIAVIDNGRGFCADDPSREQLGLSIVKTLVRDKLRGDLKIESDRNGTRAEFDFVNQITGPADEIMQY